ncbi:metal tolerance protein 1-like isoform X2 [Phalaenopsis equestris]|nr:metal tolerance protein 1-like isoform X2 [Phalaenopsis equestris]
MEAHSSQQSPAAEIGEALPAATTTSADIKTCGGPTCGLSDSGSHSKDAKERSASIRKLFIAVLLCMIFMCVEVVGGIKANSLAILTDAAHLLSDIAAFAISLFSIWAAGWEATPRQSYGFYRIEILGALVSIQLIWLLTGIILYEAVMRLIHGTNFVHGKLMFAVAAFGLLVNIIMAVLLGHNHGGHSHSHGGHGHSHSHGSHGHEHGEQDSRSIDIDITDENDERTPERRKQSINVRSAYLHVLGDSIQSIGVMIGGGIIWLKPEWKIVDLLCTLMFSFIVLITTVNMLRNILSVLMERTPREIDATKLEKGMCEVEGVVAVHELHIWAITIGKVLLACHVTIKPEADPENVLDQVIGYIRKEFSISHVTIQVEKDKASNVETMRDF